MPPRIEGWRCPDCQGPMIARENKRNGTKFWGCRSFPRCTGTRDSEGKSSADKMRERDLREPDDHERDFSHPVRNLFDRQDPD